MDDVRKTPWANDTCDIEMSACKCEKMWRMRVFCSHLPYQNRLEIRASGSQFWLQQEFALFCLSRRILILSFSMSLPDFRFWDELGSKTSLPVLVRVKKDWAGKWNSGEDSAFPIISSSSSVSHEYDVSVSHVAGFILTDHCRSSLSSRSCRSGWAHNVWEGCASPWCNTPHCAWVQWF